MFKPFWGIFMRMSLNLVLDFGNTRTKAAIFKKNELVSSTVLGSEEELFVFIDTLPAIQQCLIASVTTNHIAVYEKIKKKINTLIFSSSTLLPIKNLYKTTSTLGSDRIAASVGAYSFYPNRNVLTIDAGTCIKYNFVNANNEFIGGAISPGIKMRLKALNYYTHGLPLIEFDKNYEKLTGETTQESILSGTVFASVCEVESMIERYKQVYNNLEVVITGGDADYLCKQLKSRFFTNQNILIQGLNTILNYNI